MARLYPTTTTTTYYSQVGCPDVEKRREKGYIINKAKPFERKMALLVVPTGLILSFSGNVLASTNDRYNRAAAAEKLVGNSSSYGIASHVIHNGR